MHVTRFQEDNIPEESFETAWRDALEILREAGPDAGFVLLVVTDKGDDTCDTVFALSSGRHRITPAQLYLLIESWFHS
jgi:hypothetical protein